MAADAQQDFALQRLEMVKEIARMARDARIETGRAVLGERTMAAMAKVPRHLFVASGQTDSAYRNRPLAIGLGQTISQPFIVALMTDLMEIKPVDTVLEIGTGSGYQAAVLAQLAGTVYTIEIVEPLGREAAGRFEALGYRNIISRIGDGHQGWTEHAPFDAIMVTAAAREVPPALIEQLKPGGRLVIPIGMQSGVQTLFLIRKGADGKVTRQAVLAVRFVPLTGGSSR
jgi:protein-L-isoaspartate(D-aspartate) O-methyltransferase